MLLWANVRPHPIYFVFHFFLLAVYQKFAFISLPLPNPCMVMSKGHCSWMLLKCFAPLSVDCVLTHIL